MISKQRLIQLINLTHKHGVALAARIRTLKGKPPAKQLLRILKGLEWLNWKRRKDLAAMEAPTFFTMYDSVDVGTIPHWSEAVAGYVDGKWPTFHELIRAFPHAKRLSIAVFPRDDADCLDIETGDATPDQAPVWVRRQKARGLKRPCLYANRSTMPAVLEALARAGIRREDVRLWVADYTDSPHLPSYYDACQWTSTALGRNLDASLCRGSFL